MKNYFGEAQRSTIQKRLPQLGPFPLRELRKQILLQQNYYAFLAFFMQTLYLTKFSQKALARLKGRLAETAAKEVLLNDALSAILQYSLIQRVPEEKTLQSLVYIGSFKQLSKILWRAQSNNVQRRVCSVINEACSTNSQSNSIMVGRTWTGP